MGACGQKGAKNWVDVSLRCLSWESSSYPALKVVIGDDKALNKSVLCK
jgi:hypothetical protein